MGTELILRHESVERLQQDFETNLRKGRAFVAGGGAGLAERDLCTLRIEHPRGGAALTLRAEAVWLDPGASGGVGLSFVDFDAAAQSALRAFVQRSASADDAVARAQGGASAALDASEPADSNDAEADGDDGDDAAGSVDSTASLVAHNIHDRVRSLTLDEREALAREGTLPERVALERRYGSSVWEGLLHNPQVTAREVLRMAKSTSLPTHLVNLIVANRAWTADPAVTQALLGNPRVGGTHLERLLRGLSQAELAKVAEQSSVRMQVRQAAKRLIRR